MTSYPYEGEVQLLGYAWNPDDGPWIRIRLDEIAEMSGGPHPFNGFKKGREKGQRMKMRFDLIADDETTTEDDAPDEPVKLKGGPICKRAVMLCKNPAFQRTTYPTTEEGAKVSLYAHCHIESRAELDHNPKAAAIFERIASVFWRAQDGDTEAARIAQRAEGPS